MMRSARFLFSPFHLALYYALLSPALYSLCAGAASATSCRILTQGRLRNRVLGQVRREVRGERRAERSEGKGEQEKNQVLTRCSPLLLCSLLSARFSALLLPAPLFVIRHMPVAPVPRSRPRSAPVFVIRHSSLRSGVSRAISGGIPGARGARCQARWWPPSFRRSIRASYPREFRARRSGRFR
jgi:hypothetical protein